MKKILSVLCMLALMATLLVSCDKDHDHVFNKDKWEKDSDYHWHPCTAEDGCSEKGDKEAHDFEVSVDDEGNLINVCKVCKASNKKVSTAPAHEHTFAEKYQNSENFHWLPCTVEGCYEADGKAEHVFGNPEVSYADKKITTKYICVDCGYEKVEEQAVKTEVDNAVSWDDAFKNFKLTNFSMDVYQKYSGQTQHNHCVVTDSAAYYCIPGSREFYTAKNADGSCATYERHDFVKVFTKVEDTSDTYLVGAQTETVLQISFEDNFDKFTYDKATASYVYKGEITSNYYGFDGELNGEIICYDNVVKITDGKISYIEAKYYFPDKEDMPSSELYEASFIYYNIGVSEVEIPQAVIEGKEVALPENAPVNNGTSSSESVTDKGNSSVSESVDKKQENLPDKSENYK